MRLIDITRDLTKAPIYPGSSPVIIDRVFDMGNGAPFNSSVVIAGSHMGTHADAYCHFLNDSPVTIDKMELYRYYGPCRVLSLHPDTLLSASDFEGRIDGCERIAMRTGGKSYLKRDAIEYIVSMGILTIVTDAWSIAPLDNEAEIHNITFLAGIAVVESVILDDVEEGDYTLCAFPSKVTGCDGAAVRAVLIQK